MKRCPHCGATFENDAIYCQNCGTTLEYLLDVDPQIEDPNPAGNFGTGPFASNAQGTTGGYTQAGNPGSSDFVADQNPNVGVSHGGPLPTYTLPPYQFKTRSVVTCLILSVVTFGLYFLYWITRVNDDIDEIVGNKNRTPGLAVVAIGILTCGIYLLYWYYKLGERVDVAEGKPIGSGTSNILFLVVGIFGFGIINVALAQDTINRHLRMWGYQ